MTVRALTRRVVVALEMEEKLLARQNFRRAWFGVTAALVFPLLGATQAAANPVWMQGGHAARITGLACSADGTLIASSSDDYTVKLWSTNGTLLRTFSTEPYQATAVALSPDGTKLAAGTYYGGFASGNVPGDYNAIPGLGEVYLWQAPSGWAATNVSLVWVVTNRYGKITGLAFSSDSTRLASGNAAGSNYVHVVSNGLVVTTKPAYNTAVGPAAATSVAFSTTGLLASACEDKTIRAWNSFWSQLWTTNAAHTSNVTAVAFSPDGGLLASASLDQTIRIWSTTSWSCLQTLTGHTNGVTSVAFSPDGQTLASGCLDGSVKLWNWAGATCTATIAAHTATVTAVVFSPDGARVISGGEDDAVKIWSATDGTFIQSLGGHTDYIRAVAISPDGTLCASAGNDQSIQVRRSVDGLLLRTLSGTTGWVSAITFTPDSAVLASSGGPLDPAIKLWRLSDGAVLRTINADTNGAMALAFSPDGSMLASGGDFDEQTIQLWNPNDGSLLGTLAGHSNGVTALAFSPRGDLLASGGRRFDNTIKIWALTNSSLVQTFSGHSNNVEAVAFSPDGNTVASGSSGTNSLKVWQVSDGSSRNFGTSTNPVSFVAFSADGSTLASADQDTIKLWNVAGGTLSQTITQETFRVSCLAYSPNGNLFLYGRQDATLALVDNALGALGQPPLVFNSLTAGPDTPTILNATVQPRTHYVIQSSTNLSDWTFLTLAVSNTNLLSILDPTTNRAAALFYRAITPP
ncbi:MAG: WD40 repeat domain-containing protein [Verrucomicrobiota bacterium]|jgi:WD40 repeat protein